MNCPTTNNGVPSGVAIVGNTKFPPTEDNHNPSQKRSTLMVGVSSLYPFLFLLLKQQKPGNLYASQRPFRCMLFNNFNIYCLKNV